MSPNEQQPKQSSMDREISLRGKVIIYVVLLLFTFAPILSAMIASAVASCCGARLDESGVHPCVILGVDVGGVLYKMAVAGWFALLTVPVG